MSIYDEVKGIMFGDNFASILPNTSLEEFQDACRKAIAMQRAVNWIIGDLEIAVKQQHPKYHHQAWPPEATPEQVSRCEGVSKAYDKDERNPLATWSIHMYLAKRPDRVLAVQKAVEDGMTSDQVRNNPPPIIEPPAPEPEPVPEPEVTEAVKPVEPWLMAVDVNYFIHKYFHSGIGVESAMTFTKWVKRLAFRMHETMNLSYLVCCFDSVRNHRKTLTETWESKYKPRAEKDSDIVDQLRLVEQMLKEAGIMAVCIDEMEADDVMASYAKQFNGKVTLVTADKDMRQCLSPKCNILSKATWEEHSETGKMIPVYEWIKERWSDEDKERWKKEPDKKPKNVSSHFDDGLSYNSTKIVGIAPDQWAHFQALAGDTADGIKGCVGIGAKGAMQLILDHGSVEGVIAACKDNNADLSEIKRLAVLDFEAISEAMLMLTTLVTDLNIPEPTLLNVDGWDA